MESDQMYFRPRVDERTYEKAVEKAQFLIDNLYVRLSAGLTFESLVDSLISLELLKQNTRKTWYNQYNTYLANCKQFLNK